MDNIPALIVYIICFAVIAVGIIIFIRTLIKASKGKCCESCKSCKFSDSCNPALKKSKKRP